MLILSPCGFVKTWIIKNMCKSLSQQVLRGVTGAQQGNGYIGHTYRVFVKYCVSSQIEDIFKPLTPSVVCRTASRRAGRSPTYLAEFTKSTTLKETPCTIFTIGRKDRRTKWYVEFAERLKTPHHAEGGEPSVYRLLSYPQFISFQYKI